MFMIRKEENQIHSAADLEVTTTITSTTYHELADMPVQQIDLLAQVQQQVEFLEEIIQRHSFVMREVRYLLKK